MAVHYGRMMDKYCPLKYMNKSHVLKPVSPVWVGRRVLVCTKKRGVCLHLPPRIKKTAWNVVGFLGNNLDV